MYTPNWEDIIYPDIGIEEWCLDHLNDARRGDLQPMWLVIQGLIGYAKP